MKKLFLLTMLLLGIGLAGCLPQAAATPTATVPAQPTPTLLLTVPTQPAFPLDYGCTVKTMKPEPGVTPETVYPPVTEADHTKGPADAKITIIEYSDFQ